MNENLNKNFEPNFRLGVIFTSSVRDRSYIRFYDDDLKFVYEEKINIGGAGSYYNTKVYNDKLYVPMQGTDHISRSYMLEYDLNTVKYNILNVKQPFIYCKYGDIGDGVTVYNLKDGMQKYITLKNKVRRMNIYKNKIFVKTQSKMDVYNADTFELINSLELDWLNKFGAKFGDTSFFIKL